MGSTTSAEWAIWSCRLLCTSVQAANGLVHGAGYAAQHLCAALLSGLHMCPVAVYAGWCTYCKLPQALCNSVKVQELRYITAVDPASSLYWNKHAPPPTPQPNPQNPGPSANSHAASGGRLDHALLARILKDTAGINHRTGLQAEHTPWGGGGEQRSSQVLGGSCKAVDATRHARS
jgi:hypothetical protein